MRQARIHCEIRIFLRALLSGTDENRSKSRIPLDCAGRYILWKTEDFLLSYAHVLRQEADMPGSPSGSVLAACIFPEIFLHLHFDSRLKWQSYVHEQINSKRLSEYVQGEHWTVFHHVRSHPNDEIVCLHFLIFAEMLCIPYFQKNN